MTYREATEWLGGLRQFGARLGLDNMRALAAASDNPQDHLRFIHVAGTNGKGSVCAMLASILQRADCRVGLYTSPHLLSLRERIQINGQLIGEVDFATHATAVRHGLPASQGDPTSTLFEAATAIALRHFAAQRCDWVVWETGLGGRLDATNIVTPAISVITHIALDHQDWLGHTIEAIAAEKAGIIKPAVPVLSGVDVTAARAVIEQVAREQHAPLTCVAEEADTALLGAHQRRNAGLAAAVARQLGIADETIRAGLATVQWPGRAQLIHVSGGRRILLDGAHNVAGAEALAALLKAQFAGETKTLLIACSTDKDWMGMCRCLSPLAARVVAVPNYTEKAVPPESIAEQCRLTNPRAEVLACISVEEGLRVAANDAFLVVTGSLYLVGGVMELLGCDPLLPRGERGLNEWAKVC